MSLANGLASAVAQAIAGAGHPLSIPELVSVRTLTGNDTLTNQSRVCQRLDPGGANRDVTLPAAEHGLVYFVVNAADAAENLVIKNAAAATIATANQNEAAIVWSDGTSWYLVCLFTAPIA